MAKVTNNTQIDTINILTEAASANDTDLFLLQRGTISHKIPKNKLKWGISNLNDVLNSNDADSSLDTKLVTEKRVKDYIDNLFAVSPIISDIGYRNISSHDDTTISTGVNGSYTYTISGFNGSSLINANIRGLFVSCKIYSEIQDYYISATYPDGSVVRICEEDGDNNDDDSVSGGTFYVPIKNGQTDITFVLYGIIRRYTIVGAQVVEYI